MKIIYNPFFTGNVYLSKSLWDEVTVGDAALLEQLLMRAGLPQTVADADPEKNKEDNRVKAYSEALDAQGTTIFSQSLSADPDGTTKQLLLWRDMLVMAGWEPAMTINSTNEKLRILAACDDTLKEYPSRADRWVQVRNLLLSGKQILGNKDSVEVRIPEELILPLIKQVLGRLKTKYMQQLDETLSVDGHECTVLTPHEQYEAWQLLSELTCDDDTMLVCDDEKRMNDTMAAIGGSNWQTDRANCPHSTSSIFDQKDTPKRLIWLDCAGNRPNTNPYAFLTAADLDELKQHGIQLTDDETRSAVEAKWLNTLLNSIHEWILVTPKCHLGDALGEHAVITSIKQNADFYNAACEKGNTIALPLTAEQPTVKINEIGDIQIDDKLIKCITPPSDSYSTIEQLVDKPLDYVLEKLGGLTAPEDDEEPNEHLMMGPIAHKMVELLVNNPATDGAYPLEDIRLRFHTQYDRLFEQSMKECENEAAFMTLDENKNLLAVFKDELHKTIESLLETINANDLTPCRCEYEITTPFGPFANPHGFIDMLLTDKDGNWVIFDFKWSSRNTYPKGLEKGEAYQLYMYKHAVEAQLGGKVAWYGYYLFPDMKLYTCEKEVPKWGNWLDRRKGRLNELANGTIRKAEKDEYPKHLILKNLNLK